MYNNPYMMNYNSQASIDRLNEQINNLEKIKAHMQQQPQPQPTNLTQNFQLAPTSRDVIRYATSLEEVKRDMVIGDTPYFSKDMSVVWIKNTKGDIKTYELNEIIPKDEKDIQIEILKAEIDELKKGRIVNEQPTTNDNGAENATNTTTTDGTTGTTVKKSKSTSVPRVSTGKKK
jgi:hypothetical protein